MLIKITIILSWILGFIIFGGLFIGGMTENIALAVIGTLIGTVGLMLAGLIGSIVFIFHVIDEVKKTDNKITLAFLIANPELIVGSIASLVILILLGRFLIWFMSKI
ncbi:MAG: hypothetical protein Q7K40_05480 [bacterium]|nr:hypothetical protein [bacterium]